MNNLSAIAYQLSQHDDQHFDLLITASAQQAYQLANALRFFSNKDTTVTVFPDYEVLPYDYFSPHVDIISDRLRILHQLPTQSAGFLIVALPTLMQFLPPKAFIDGHVFLLKQGGQLNLEQFRHQLAEAGYRAVSQVETHGEINIRGGLIDIFPMGSNTPFRIELFDDEVSSIRIFDPETQRTIDNVNQIEILPAHEFPLNKSAITQFRENWRLAFNVNVNDCPLYQQVSKGIAANGIENYLPLFFDQLNTLFDYLPTHTKVTRLASSEAAQHFWQEVDSRYQQLCHDVTRPLLSPEKLYLRVEHVFSEIKKFTEPNITLDDEGQQPLPSLDLDTLDSFLGQHTQSVVFLADSPGRREILKELLETKSIHPKLIDHWYDFSAKSTRFYLLIGHLATGFITPDFIIITEADLLGEVTQQETQSKKSKLDPALLIRSLHELKMNAPVVHEELGIGRYQGLKKITTDNLEQEFIELEYANQDKIYLPIQSLNLLSRYSGHAEDKVELTKLGSNRWQQQKEKAFKRIRDVAAELLKTYSERQAKPGFAFHFPQAEFKQFKAEFPFIETPDQQKAINAITQDMTTDHCMDRLVCGDVGFGKTEVAMQAAFLAVQSNKQVAVLAPTTLLATQHTTNFQDRFANWPIKIAGLSRFQSPAEQKRILTQLEEGKVDIIIGTHKLLSSDVKFKDLGLLIIDEEHRFGVRQKEQIRRLRSNIDILALTATPIPRTLNMSLSAIRDLSIIATPPARRLAIKTFVHEYQEQLIKEAILRETLRGGQIYFLHNDVATIEKQAHYLQKLVPDLKIAIGHGQMPEKQLERVMSDFYHQKYDLLLATTIIESGIDIPSANTMIINRADKFGLAQLHQLRGRVGRSHHQAYCYLLVPPKALLSKDAERRLEAISSLEDLGAGFHLAMHDMEIRGAGELLGEEQSGQMEAIGFSLYMELLEEAVKVLKSGQSLTELEQIETNKTHIEVDLQITTILPETYIPDVNNRITFYKRISSAKHHKELRELRAELIDRYGLLPEATEYLFSATELKLKALPLKITKIEANKQFAYLFLDAKPNINVAKLLELIQTQPKVYSLKEQHCLRIRLADSQPRTRLSSIESTLNKLSPSDTKD